MTRKIPKAPFKVLDAPELQDDFYLNLLDWSSLNLLAVGLGSAVYLWNACTCQVCILPSLASLYNQLYNPVFKTGQLDVSCLGHFFQLGRGLD